MKIYRVTLRTDGDAHGGHKYVPNKVLAQKLQNEQNKESGCEDEVDTLEIEPTKKDILSFLNAYCSYPDNG